MILPGVISDVELPVLYRLADVFVFPSLREGWGLVLLEAIASGLPVITANEEPFTEFLSPSNEILLIDVHSVDTISQAMLSILSSDSSSSLLKQSQSILNDYSWAACAKMHIDIYNLAFI